jgi:CRISPR-associated endoribonuclease Cas6
MVQDVSLKPHKTDTLHSLVVELGAAEKANPPATLGRAIYAQVLQWLQLGDPQISAIVHASQNPPITLSSLLGNRRKQGIQAGDTFYFRICLLDGDLVQPLLRGIEQWGTQPLILGKFPLVFRQFYTLPWTHPLVNSSSYQLLAQTSRITKEIELYFVSPTSFKQKLGIQSFPLPELVFGSLQRKWNIFAPAELQFPVIEWQGLVSAFDLKTHALKLEGGAEIGAQGWVRYYFSDEEQAKVATILSHFACFSGVGRKTTMGMGQVKLKLRS